MNPSTSRKILNVLALDGGGSKGVYTLGVLKEVEAKLGGVLADHFGLIYGTSTGAIIASMLSQGDSVEAIEKRYFDLIPKVMAHKTRAARSRELRNQAEKLFSDEKFDSFQTYIGLVATNYEFERPMVFKNSAAQSYGRVGTFEPGFGCTIVEALMASTAAFPFFDRLTVKTLNQGAPEVMDGGFSANNPTLFAIADAVQALGFPRENVRVLSVGVGHYNEPQRNWYSEIVLRLWPFQMIRKQLAINSNTVEILRQIFVKDIKCIRVDDSFPDSRYATDLLESRPEFLRKLFTLGRESYAKFEDQIVDCFAQEEVA